MPDHNLEPHTNIFTEYEVMVFQYWGDAQRLRITQKDGDTVLSKNILNGITLTGFYNEETMEYYAIVSLSDSIVTVSTTHGQDRDTIIDSLSFLQ